MIGSAGLGKTTLSCIEVIVNDCQCWSWKGNFCVVYLGDC